MAGSRPQSNFTHLKVHDEQLVRLGLLAERYFAEDPSTCLIKLRQLTELLAQLVASQIGLFTSPEEKQVDLLRRLQDQGIVPREVGALFAEVRRAGNDANHRLAGDHPPALLGLRRTARTCSCATASARSSLSLLCARARRTRSRASCRDLIDRKSVV